MRLERPYRHPPKRLDDGRAHGEIRHEVPVHHVHVDSIGSGLRRLRHLLAQTGEVGGENRRRECDSDGAHVLDASKMLSTDLSSTASYSASDCWADSPSRSAREKLATTPWFPRKRLLPS